MSRLGRATAVWSRRRARRCRAASTRSICVATAPLYEHELMRWLDEQAIGYAISADMSIQLSECIAALPEEHWKPDQQEADAIREWAEVNYLPSDGVWKKDAVSPRRYLAIRIRPRQGELLRDGIGCVTSASSPTAPIPKAAVASI